MEKFPYDGLPPEGLPVACVRLRGEEGEHPKHLKAMGALHGLSPLHPTLPMFSLGLPLAPLTHGHHTMQDEGYLHAAGQTDIWPLAPVFVRDLAGRVVHTGFNVLPTVPTAPVMPATCAYIPPTTEGYELLDKTFFTMFRRLEWNLAHATPLAGRPNLEAHALYAAPQAYPYKLRVDSFYQDGFRLPQVERLLVQPDAGNANAMGTALLSRWDERPEGQDYTAFYEANQGDAWFEEMFAGGCTVIPTLEAYNGTFKVNADYTMADVWPGCAVEGLHEVLDYRPDSSPAGTILEVIRPGFVTRDVLIPAHVIASDGSGYVSPLGEAPPPLQPNPQLPHPRVAACADVWLATHPGHFELPALWDWNADGHFQQVAGPLWDPVHYVYASTPRIIKAFKAPNPSTPHQAPVPADMLPTFHPVVALATYDTFRASLPSIRFGAALYSPFADSVIDTLPMGRTVAEVGYHPLPAPLEYDLDPCVFPHLSPRHRPEEMPEHVAPVIQSTVTAEEAQKLITLWPENKKTALFQTSVMKGGYHCARTQAPDMPLKTEVFPFCFVPHQTTTQLMINVKRFFMSKAYVAELESLAGGLYEQFFAFREASLASRRLRHRMLAKYAGWYVWAWWFQHSLEKAEQNMLDNPAFFILEAEQLLRQQHGVLDVTSQPAP